MRHTEIVLKSFDNEARETTHELHDESKRHLSMDPNRYEVSEPELLRGLRL